MMYRRLPAADVDYGLIEFRQQHVMWVQRLRENDDNSICLARGQCTGL